jgi:hypothetical protein
MYVRRAEVGISGHVNSSGVLTVAVPAAVHGPCSASHSVSHTGEAQQTSKRGCCISTEHADAVKLIELSLPGPQVLWH